MDGTKLDGRLLEFVLEHAQTMLGYERKKRIRIKSEEEVKEIWVGRPA